MRKRKDLEDRTDLTPTERNLWRTLVRVTRVDKETVYVIVPGWNPYIKDIPLLLESLPEEVASKISLNYRFHAKVNIGVRRAEDLYFRDFEDK